MERSLAHGSKLVTAENVTLNEIYSFKLAISTSIKFNSDIF